MAAMMRGAANRMFARRMFASSLSPCVVAGSAVSSQAEFLQDRRSLWQHHHKHKHFFYVGHGHQLVVKSQGLTGGRGLSTFNIGLKGGGHTFNRDKVEEPAGFKALQKNLKVRRQKMGSAAEITLMAQVEEVLALELEAVELPSVNKRIGLVIVDEVVGFCKVGGGAMAPVVPSAAITQMVKETEALAKQFSERGWPIIAFLDTHEKNKPEPPYPPHCIKGTGEENFVEELLWLEKDPNTTMMRKDCINGFVGGIQTDGSNIVCDWVRDNNVQQMLVVGICTDVCVMDFVLTALSARNHGIMAPLEDVIVYSEGCSTYVAPGHPEELTHYMGLYFAKSRGAQVVNKVTLK